jgi:hypothetical protein
MNTIMSVWAGCLVFFNCHAYTFSFWRGRYNSDGVGVSKNEKYTIIQNVHTLRVA